MVMKIHWSLLSLLLLLSVLIVGAQLTPFSPTDTNPADAAQPPDKTHWLGTDHLGRDVLSRVLHGGLRTIGIATAATGTAALMGGGLGLFIGFGVHGWGLLVFKAFVNAVLAFPQLLVALLILTLLGHGGGQVALAVGLAQSASFARITYGAVVAISVLDYIRSAEALGAVRGHILRWHILPNIQPAFLGYAGLVFAYSIINSAGLAFLGLAGSPGWPDWGVMLAEGRTVFRTAPWVSLAPGIAISITIWMVNRLVDRLNTPQSL